MQDITTAIKHTHTRTFTQPTFQDTVTVIYNTSSSTQDHEQTSLQSRDSLFSKRTSNGLKSGF